MIKKRHIKCTLMKEISWTLFLKIVAIMVLWYLCFSHPVADSITQQQMQQHLNLSNHAQGNSQ